MGAGRGTVGAEGTGRARIPREEGSIVSSRDRAPGARASGRTARAISAPGADKTMTGKYRDIEDDDAMVYGRRAAASRVRGCARQGTTVGTPGS